MTEVEMVGWHHRLNGHEFEQALGVGDGRKPGMLQSMGYKELDKTEQLNYTELIVSNHIGYGQADLLNYLELEWTWFPIPSWSF